MRISRKVHFIEFYLDLFTQVFYKKRMNGDTFWLSQTLMTDVMIFVAPYAPNNRKAEAGRFARWAKRNGLNIIPGPCA